MLRQIPAVNIFFRVLDLTYFSILFALGVLMTFRAGSTGLAQGSWVFPEIPEFLIVFSGLLVLNVSIRSLIQALMPKALMQQP